MDFKRSKLYAWALSVVTSPLLITAYIVIGLVTFAFCGYHIMMAWVQLNTKLIEAGYLSMLNSPGIMNAALTWIVFEILIAFAGILIVILCTVLLIETRNHIMRDMKKYDVEQANLEAKSQ